MPSSFCYDRRESYYAQQDFAPDLRYAAMRDPGPSTIDDLFEKFSHVMRATFRNRTRLWGGWNMAKPKNSKPRRKDHRA